MKQTYPCVIKPKASENYLKDNPSYWVVKVKHSEEKWDADYYTFQTRKKAMEFYDFFNERLEEDKYFAELLK